MIFSSRAVMPPQKRPFGGARQGQNKNIENNPMQSRIELAHSNFVALRPEQKTTYCATSGAEEKAPT
jgi:hypothetical protein